MGRIAGRKNLAHLPDELRSVSKSVTLTAQEWEFFGENPTRKAAEALRRHIQRMTPQNFDTPRVHVPSENNQE